jgi:hypothetical protein
MIPPASFSDRNESQLPGTRRPLEANTGGESDSNIHPLSTIPPHQQSDHGSSLLQFRFSVNKQGKNKDWDYRLLTKCFEDTVGTIEDLADFVLKGFAVSGAWLGGKQRKSKNCLGIQVILLDFDNSKLLRDNHGKALKDKNGNQIRVYDPQYLIEHAKADPNFQSLCGFAYTSPSHQLDWHRFRVVIPLARWITKQADIDAIISWCQQQFPGCDLSCKDRARAFFGNTNADIIAINPTAGISEEQLERILAETCAEKAGYVQKRQWHLLPDLNPQDRWQLIKSAIDSIDPDCSYDEWLAVGMALRSLGEQWLSVWDEWSAQGAKYRPGECERKWRGFSTTSGITLGTLFWLGKKYGWSFPQRDSSKAFARIKQRMEAIMLSAYRQEITLEQMEFELSTLRGQAFNARVSNNQWLGLRYELEERIFHSSNAREQFQEWQGFKQLKQWLKRLQKLSGRAEGFGGRRQSQPKSKPPLKTIEYQPGKLPKSCEYITPPKVLYKSNQLPQLIQEARAAGWKDLLDTTTPGGGKSYRYAMLSLSTLGVNDGGRAWLLSQGHRNPTTAPAEHNYADMPVRSRSGFVVDPERKTATGKPYLRYPTTEEAKFLPQGNCHLADLIHAAAAKRIESASEEAQLNPFCAICKHRGYCGQHSGPGYGYRYERRDLFENQYQVRSSLDSLPKPSSYHYGHDAAILDEPLQQLKPVRVINADITDLLAQWDELGYQLPQVAAQLAPLKTALMPLIRGVNIPYYGLNHEQLLPLLPPVPEGFIDTLARIRVAMSVDVAVLNRDTPDLVSTQEDIDKIASLKAKIKRRSEKLEKLRAELFELQQVEDELRMVGQQLSLEVEFLGFRYTSAEALKLLERRQKLPELLAEVETELVQFRAQLEQQECTRQTVKDVNRRQYQEAKRSLQESIEALPNQWLVPFLEVWGGQSRGAIRIDRFGLKLAVLDNRHNQVLNSLKTRYYLDATATPQILALYRQIPVSQILWIELEQPPVDNLDFVWVTGMGLASKNRSESCDQRLKILHATLKSWVRTDITSVTRRGELTSSLSGRRSLLSACLCQILPATTAFG